MSRIDWVEKRLWDWAEWLRAGDGSGYSSKCTLHPEWSPPTPGTTPTMKVAADSRVPETHRAVLLLSERLQHTLVLHYCTGLPVVEQALRLACQPGTVDSRIRSAHRELARLLHSESSPFTE